MLKISILLLKTVGLSMMAFLLSILPNPLKIEKHRYLYVAVPGIRNYLEYGGHGLLIYDIDNNFSLVKRISTTGLAPDGTPSNVKGICVSLATQSVYISTVHTLQCIDLQTEKLKWEKTYEGGCDRMAISPDGLTIYQPSFEKDNWNIINAANGEVIDQVVPKSGAHNTIFGPDGKEVYLEGLKSPFLTVVNAKNPKETRTVGPFSASIRPFTITHNQKFCFANINDLLGFEVGDLKTGKKLYTVKINGYEKGVVKRHGCPSHGIGLTPNEKELWVADAFNQRFHYFDATKMPPLQMGSVVVRDQPGWITFSLDGKYAFPSTGEIIDLKTKKIFTTLKDENGNPVHSEKVVEIHFEGSKAVTKGDQFGIGRK
ncbi:YncE family protein [Emticicia sp.]|uniref:YncE family protein n=1 Tax=Emticicia sp. TaxID=1930953 RepID=UPI0037524FBC